MLPPLQASTIAHVPPRSRVLLRVDYNIPFIQGAWRLNQRVHETLGLIHTLLAKNCAVLLVSHKGRPEPGTPTANDSFKTLTPSLSTLLSHPVTFLETWPFSSPSLELGQVYLAENTRFLIGETSNSNTLSSCMTEHIDCVVMDAFACSHRSHASTVGILQKAKQVFLGCNHLSEIQAIQTLLSDTSNQKTACIGGKKLSTKLPLLSQLLQTTPSLCIGGGLANTLLFAQGYSLGVSWVEYEQITEAKLFLQRTQDSCVNLELPIDVQVVDGTPGDQSVTCTRSIHDIRPNDCIVDIGPQTRTLFVNRIQQATCLYWNGPLGFYEKTYGKKGTLEIARCIASSAAPSCIGGGDTLSAIQELPELTFTHKSTGGGAFLQFLANQTSPVLEAFREKQQNVSTSLKETTHTS